MKKADSRSHSWWWDSHISPKNSKWLQENLTEMDTKVSAMLKIIEEDADSFAQRAEMYYRRRPELINLIEEFYRTYRALVERYNFLTREIRQNMAPALQAQLGISPESAQNSPIDHVRRGMDGFDIISPSYSYPGPSEFDDDTQSEVSTKSWKGHNDEEESSPLGSATNLESHSFAFRPKFPGLEEESYQRSHLEHGGPHGSADVDISQLQKELQHLQDENKALAAKASEDVSSLKNLQLELSSLQSRMRSLETEDKMTKKRLKSVLEQEQKLESENLKLSHALILSKEEKTELVELRKKEIEKNNVAGCKIVQLEEEAASIKKELLAAQLQVSVGLEHAKKCEEEIMKVQTALANLLEEKERDSLSLDGTFEQLIQELQEWFFFLKQENGRLKEQIVCGAMEVKRLEGQLLELTNDKENLEQVLVDLRKQIEVLEVERFAAVLKSQELQNELEMSHKDMQNLSSRNLESSEQIVKLEEMIQELQHKCSRLETENMEGSGQVVKLNADTQELQRVRDRLMAECEECKVNCQALQMSEVQLKDQIASLADDKAHLQEQNKVVEAMVANVDRHVKELQQNLATLESEKIALAKQLDNALEQVNASKIHHRELEMRAEVIQGERDKHKQDLSARSVHVKELEETLRQLTEVKTTLEKRDLEAQQEILELKQKHLQLREELGVESALSKSLNDKKLELEKGQTVMASKVQEILTKLALLQEENATLSCNYGKSQADHQSAMEAVRRAEEDLSLSLRELRHLQDEMKAKREQLENEIEAVRKELAESQSVSSLLAQDKEDCLKRLADAEAKVSDLNTKFSGLLVVHADLTKEVLEKGRCIEMLKVELSDMCQMKANLEEENTLMAEHARVLQEQIDNLERAEKVLKLDVGSSLKRSEVLEAEVQQLQQAVSHAEGQNTILTCEQQKVLEESFVMKEKIKDLKEEMDRLSNERNVLFAEVALQTDQSKELKLRLNNLQAEKHALDHEMELSQKQLAKFEDEVMSLGEGKELLAKKLTDTQGQLENLKSCLSDEQGKKESLANELSETTGQVEALKVQVSDLQKEKAILQEQIDLKSLDAASLVAQIESCNEQESALHAQLKKMAAVVHSLESELEILRLAASKAKEVRESFAQERNFLNAEVALHTGQSEELKLRLSSLQVEKVAVEHELDLLEKQLANFEKENKSLGEGKELLAKKLADAQAYIMDLEPRLSESSGKNVSLANELSEQAGQVEALKLQLSELQNAKATLQEDVKLKSHDAACLLAQIEVHKEQQSNLQTQLKDKSDLIQSLEAQLEMLKAAASKAEEHKDSLAQDHQRSLDENLFMQKRFEDLQERLGHATQERELLLKVGDLLVEHCNELERSIKILEDEKVGLQKELLRMGSLAEQLKEEVKNLHSEKNQISETLQVELLKVQNTEEDMAKLQMSLRSTLKEQESVMEMLKLRSQEKDALEVQYADLQAESKEIKLESLKAKEEAKNIEADLIQIWQANIALLKEITTLQEEVLKLESRKKELEEKLQMDDRQIVLLKDEMNTLQQALALTQDDKERFEEMALQSAAECSSAQKALTDIEEKLDKEVSSHHLLQLEKEEVVASLMVLEKGLAQVQEEKATMTKILESTQQGLSSLQGEHASLVQASLMQSQEKEEKITSLQQQIKALESQKSVFSETMSKMSLDFVSAEESLKDELAQLKSESCQHEKNLCHQRGLVGQLEAEIQKLRSDSMVLQEYSAIGASRISNIEREVLELQGYNDRLKKQLQDKNTELSRLSESSELLQQSVVLAKQESIRMKESLDCCSAAKEKLAGEYKHLQSEEENWKTKATADAALISELESKISVLVVEKAALADEISENAEHCFKLQEKVKSLIVANGEMTQNWQTEVAEALRLEAALKACKEEELPALQSELAKVQTENLAMHTLRQRERSESLMVDKRMKDFTDEVTHLQEKVSKLEDELAAQTARLVDLEGNLSRLSIENSELAEKVHLQEGQRVELEELLGKSQEENDGLKAHVETGTDRGNDLQAKIENLQLQMDVQHQHDLERYSSTVADLAATKEQNRSLREAVSNETASVTELRKEVSTLLKEKRALEDAMVSANTQITNSEMEVSKLQGAKQSLSCELDKKNKHVHQLISSFGDVYFMISNYLSKDLNPTVDENQNTAHQKVTGRHYDPTKVAHGEGTEAEKIRVELLKDSTLWEPASGNMESVQREETPALECLFKDGLNGLQKLRDEIRDLLEENDSLKNQCLAAWTEFNLILNSSKEWQEKVSRLQQENGHLLLEISSYETEAKLLEDKFASLETENKGIHVALDGTALELGKLQGMLSHLQVEGIKLIMLLKEKLGVSNKEMKDLTEEFQRHIEEKGLLEHGLPRPVAEEVAPEVEKVDWTDEHPEMPLLEARNEAVLSQIQISVEQAELLQYAIEFFRKVMYNFVQKSQRKDVNDREELVILKTVEDDEPNNQDLCIADADQTELLVNGNAGSLPYHINLGTRLHQAYMDEQLEHDLLELKEGRKQLKEDLEARVVEVQRMQNELEGLQKVLEEGNRADGGSGGSRQQQKWSQKKRRVEARVIKLEKELVEQKQQIVKMHAEYTSGTREEEALAESLEEQVLVLVSQESAPTMDGWDEEQVNRLSKELERMKTLNRRQSLELHTMSQNLVRVGSLIQSAQQQLLTEGLEQEENDNVSGHKLRGSVSLEATSSTMSSGIPFPFKSRRGLDFSWLLLLFSPEKKENLGERSSRSKRLAFLRPILRSSSSSSALTDGSRKTVGCWACTRSSSRLDSFENM